MIQLLLIAAGVALLFLGSVVGLLWHTEPPTGPKWIYYGRRVVGLVLATVGLGFLASAPGAKAAGADEGAKLQWGTQLDKALERGKAENRPVIVDAWAPWCASCRKLDEETFTDPAVVKGLQRFERVKLNMDLPENEPLWERYSIKGLPWVAFFTAEGTLNEGLTLTDFEEPEAFLARLGKVDELVEHENVVAGQIRKHGIFWAMVFVFFAGVLSSLTPCVYPLIPVVLAVIGTRVVAGEHKRGRAFTLSLAFTAALVLTYASLGALVAGTNSAIGKDTMQNPWVVGTVVGVFFIMALSLLGLFTIQVPASLQAKLQQRQFEMADARDAGKSGGYGLAAFSGFFSALVAAPCVGPVLVGILAYASQLGDPLLAFGLMLVFGTGFGVLFLVLGTFSGLLNKIPRSGPWMERVKVGFALAFAFVGMITLAAVQPELAELPERLVGSILG